MEFCEVASMSMELLGAPYIGRENGGFYDPAQATLGSDDIAGVCFLYPHDAAAPSEPADDIADGGVADGGVGRDAGCGRDGCGSWDVPFGAECDGPEQCESGHCLERSSGPVRGSVETVTSRARPAKGGELPPL